MTRSTEKLPTLAELRARRTTAMQAAIGKLIPRLLTTSLILVPAFAAVALAQSGRLRHDYVIPLSGAIGVLGMFWTGYVVLDYVRRILPAELSAAGLLCHSCGVPLVPPAAARGAAANRTGADPAVLAALEGKCASCGTWVVRDGVSAAA